MRFGAALKFAARLTALIVGLIVLYQGIWMLAPLAEKSRLATIATLLTGLGWAIRELEQWSARRTDREWEELQRGARMPEPQPGWEWEKASTEHVTRLRFPLPSGTTTTTPHPPPCA